MPKLEITDPAQSDLDDIFEHYAPLVGEAEAEQIVIRLLEKLEPLETFPGMGRPSQKPSVRELVFTRYPFLAQYRVKDDTVQILRVVHQRSQHPADW
ncbi:type II toxin-antitoxin system RelE/ParE family toxin [Azotobacter beijerinckii]|uniref:Plasmid stabilization system protein ParE n=1 Tax=Azotobacter beijerinckii TaxID=170623 RepID=A0A1I4JBM1_9GAMM|nr:type II toxin-antitoxin system RelE/ParE family toxin [Azotobacter beijerinckii]SFB65478.1 Plasmid stabilization system protein ParE [Azotobacter beijerinckii]SFL63930.1 Plasmid stabilization system protein ParE [Azotobacter beijerinckii]